MSGMQGRGDVDFGDFVAATTPVLLRFARGLGRDEHDAWDLLQDTYVKVGARWDRVSTLEEPVAYTRKAMLRLAIDRSRRRDREGTALARLRALGDRQEASTAPPPDATAERDGTDWLPGAWQRLTTRQRAVITLHLVEDRSTAETADLLGCGVGSVRTHLSRGLARLREAAPSREGQHRG